MSKFRGGHRSGKMPDDVRAMLRGDACDGKIAYTDRSKAADAQHGMKSKGKPCRVYRCVKCGKYHLASQGGNR